MQTYLTRVAEAQAAAYIWLREEYNREVKWRYDRNRGATLITLSEGIANVSYFVTDEEVEHADINTVELTVIRMIYELAGSHERRQEARHE